MQCRSMIKAVDMPLVLCQCLLYTVVYLFKVPGSHQALADTPLVGHHQHQVKVFTGVGNSFQRAFVKM
ncbi:hypothetical protein D3C86_2015180 [compost metagenome]